jgi:aldehyde:ferredoxin oxidoreductase
MEIEVALDEYYKLAGFTNQGTPTSETLSQLGIAWAADYLPG